MEMNEDREEKLTHAICVIRNEIDCRLAHGVKTEDARQHLLYFFDAINKALGITETNIFQKKEQ